MTVTEQHLKSLLAMALPRLRSTINDDMRMYEQESDIPESVLVDIELIKNIEYALGQRQEPGSVFFQETL